MEGADRIEIGREFQSLGLIIKSLITGTETSLKLKSLDFISKICRCKSIVTK